MDGSTFVHHWQLIRTSSSCDAPDRDLKQNTIATSDVARRYAKEGVKKLAFSSTSAVYGPSPVQPILKANLAVRSRFTVRRSSGARDSFTLTLTFLTFKPGFFALPTSSAARFAKRQDGHFGLHRQTESRPQHLEILGKGLQAKSYILVDECVDAMLLRDRQIQRAVSVYNLGCNDWLSVNQICEVGCRGRRIKDRRVPLLGGEAGCRATYRGSDWTFLAWNNWDGIEKLFRVCHSDRHPPNTRSFLGDEKSFCECSFPIASSVAFFMVFYR